MTNDPEEIRSRIEETRAELGTDVDALREKVSPSAMAQRQARRFGGMVTGVRDRVMGVASDVTSDVGSAGSSVASTMGDAASTVGDAAREAPTMVRRQTEGNPLAAGLIAFSAGWLVSSLLPASRPERQAATAVKDMAGGMTEDLSGTVRQMADDLREPASQAVESVKSTAQEAAQNVREEGMSAGQEVRDTAQQSKENIQQNQ